VCNDIVELVDAVRRQHEDDQHTEHFRWCERPACVVASRLDVEYLR
jgi:hypothetical protein